LAYQGRADAYSANAQFDAAVADYECALALAPKEAVVYLRRGRAYLKLGRPEQAAHDFRQVLNLTNKSHLLRQTERLLVESTTNFQPENESA
jgi:tetratricopeptide (TPR) repeat protein